MKRYRKINNLVIIITILFITCMQTKAEPNIKAKSEANINISTTLSPTKTSATVVITATSEFADIDYITVNGKRYNQSKVTIIVEDRYRYTITCKDKLGNDGFSMFSIQQIVYKPAIKTKITYSDNKKYAYCSVNCTSDGSSIDYILINGERFNGDSATYRFTENSFYNVQCFDVLGNSSTSVVNIDGIVYPPPEFIIKTNNTSYLKDNTNIIVEVTSNYNPTDYIEIGGEKFIGTNTATKTVYLNGDYSVKVVDKAGLFVEKIISIKDIVYPPKLELSQKYNQANNTVTIHIKALSNGREINNILVNGENKTIPTEKSVQFVNGVKYYISTSSYVVNKNYSYLIKAVDSLGLSSEEVITVTSIDDSDPDIHTIIILN